MWQCRHAHCRDFTNMLFRFIHRFAEVHSQWQVLRCCPNASSPGVSLILMSFVTRTVVFFHERKTSRGSDRTPAPVLRLWLPPPILRPSTLSPLFLRDVSDFVFKSIPGQKDQDWKYSTPNADWKVFPSNKYTSGQILEMDIVMEYYHAVSDGGKALETMANLTDKVQNGLDIYLACVCGLVDGIKRGTLDRSFATVLLSFLRQSPTFCGF